MYKKYGIMMSLKKISNVIYILFLKSMFIETIVFPNFILTI